MSTAGNELRKAAAMLHDHADCREVSQAGDSHEADRLAGIVGQVADEIDRLVVMADEYLVADESPTLTARRRRRWFGLVPGLAVIAVLAGACVPYQAPPAPAAPTVEVDVFADSMGAQMMGQGLTTLDPHRQWDAMNGATVNYWAYSIAGAINDPNIRVITLALGGNDAAVWGPDGGWTPADESAWTNVLSAIHPDTCTIIVLPWMTAPVEQTYPGSLANVDRARAWFTQTAAAFPNVVLADWADVVNGWTGDTPVMADDGIHLGSGPAAEARYNLIVGAEARCP